MHHFKSIGEFKLKLQSGNPQFGSISANVLPRVTLKFDSWTWKTKGRLFYTTSSFVHHFKAICEIQLELQSGNAQFGSKLAIFFRVTLKFDGLPWKTIVHLFYATSSFVLNFHSHRWFKTGVTVRKCPIWFKIDDFFCGRVTLKLDRWPWKTIGRHFCVASSFVHHFVAIGEFKLELQSGNAQSGSNSTILAPCDLEIWRMILKNNRAPLLSNIVAIGEFKLELQSGNVQFGSK